MLSKIRSTLTRNWFAKLVCLLIAVGLWLWVVQQQSAKESFDVELEYINKPDNVVVTNQSDRFVTVVLRGQKSKLNTLQRTDLKVQIDLGDQLGETGAQPGEEWIWIQPRDVRHPRGLEVESIKPRSVHVVMERNLSKEVPVEASIVAGPPEGFDYTVQVDPDTAVISGPDYVVRAIDRLQLERVTLKERTSSFTEESLPAILRDQDIRLEYPKENKFRLTVNVTERKITRKITDIPVQVENVPPGKKAIVEPAQLDLFVKGPQRQVQRLSADDFTVRVRIDKPEKRQNIYVPEIILPQGVTRVRPPQGEGGESDVTERIKQVLVTLVEE